MNANTQLVTTDAPVRISTKQYSTKHMVKNELAIEPLFV